MTDDELTIPDVLSDENKNLCNKYRIEDEDEEPSTLKDSLYYTETELNDFMKEAKYSNNNNLVILSLNIANLFSKLNSFKTFVNNVKYDGVQCCMKCDINYHRYVKR